MISSVKISSARFIVFILVGFQLFWLNSMTWHKITLEGNIVVVFFSCFPLSLGKEKQRPCGRGGKVMEEGRLLAFLSWFVWPVLIIFVYTTFPEKEPSTVGCVFSHQSLTKKISHRPNYSLIWWRDYFSFGFISTRHHSLYQVEKIWQVDTLSTTHTHTDILICMHWSSCTH